MAEVTVKLEAEVHPTEDEEKVKETLNKILGSAIVTTKPLHKGSILTTEAKGQDALIKFRTLLRQDHIRDAARKLLFRSIRGNTIIFCLNKQVASVGHISFSEETAESPLGPILVTITSDNPRKLVEWLAERNT